MSKLGYYPKDINECIYVSNHLDYFKEIYGLKNGSIDNVACEKNICNQSNFTFKEGYEVLLSTMDKVILHEAKNNGRITIGGKIVFAILNKDEFRLIKSIEDLPDE